MGSHGRAPGWWQNMWQVQQQGGAVDPQEVEECVVVLCGVLCVGKYVLVKGGGGPQPRGGNQERVVTAATCNVKEKSPEDMVTVAQHAARLCRACSRGPMGPCGEEDREAGREVGRQSSMCVAMGGG